MALSKKILVSFALSITLLLSSGCDTDAGSACETVGFSKLQCKVLGL